MFFFFIIYTFDIQFQKYDKHNEKEKSEVLDSMIDEVKPKKKRRTFKDKKWEAVTKEFELRKKMLPRTDESKLIIIISSENKIDDKWEEIRKKSNWLRQSRELKLQVSTSSEQKMNGYAVVKDSQREKKRP